MEKEETINFYEGKKPKNKLSFFETIGKIIGNIFIIIIGLILVLLLFYYVSTKIAQKKGITPLFGMFTIISPSMEPNIKVYDVVLIKRVSNMNSLKKGDVITFYASGSNYDNLPITHRISEITKTKEGKYSITTKGDNNVYEDTDFQATEENIIGAVLMKFPGLGKVQFFLASKGGWVVAILVPALGVIAYDVVKFVRLLIIKKRMKTIEDSERL